MADTPVTGLQLNAKRQLFIDVNGGKSLKDISKADFEWLADGIAGITPAMNETATQTAFYNMNGGSQDNITGKRMTLAITGNRVHGDKAQDFVASHYQDVGGDLVTLAAMRDVDGSIKVGAVTLTAIVPFGGNSNAYETFSFTISFNGKATPATADQVPLPAVEYIGEETLPPKA